MKKILIGILLSTGFVFFAVAISVFLQKNPSEDDKESALGCLIIAAPPTAIGGWLIWDLRRTRNDFPRASQRKSREYYCD
jgi:hypothetical protein